MGERYVNIREGLNSKPRLVPISTRLEEIIKNSNKDYYRSLYTYDDSHKKRLEETGSLAGITDTLTNKLFFDFDDKENVANAKEDTIAAANKLLELGVNEEAIGVYFTGNKGFSIEVTIDEFITPAKFGAIIDYVAGNLKTLDPVVREANRIVRLSNTKHQSSGLYKIPLTPEELVTLSVDDIKKLAKKPRLTSVNETVVTLPEELKNVKVVEKRLDTIQNAQKDLSFDITSIDMKNRPKGLDEARWLLSNGFFRSGERNNAMLCLAATYKSLNHTEQMTRGALQGIALDQAARTGEDVFSDREIDLIIGQVYGPNWKGGIFTTKDPNNWLAKYAKKMGLDTRSIGSEPMQITDVNDEFEDFVKNYEVNLIETGVPFIDEMMPLTIGTNAAILGAPGSGKTTLALNILKSCSNKGMDVVFFSLDMHRKRMFEKIMYDVTGLNRSELYEAYKRGEGKELLKLMKAQYANVWFYDRSGTKPEDMAAYIRNIEEYTGRKVKLCMVDYLERVSSDKNSDTEASKDIAQKIQDLVMDLDIACLTLVQPAKYAYSGGPDTPLESLSAIKGSSYLSQSYRNIISLWRPGYSPEFSEYDKFIELAILKNDLGGLGKTVMKFNGAKGRIENMEDGDRDDYKHLIAMKKQSKDNKDGNDGWT